MEYSEGNIGLKTKKCSKCFYKQKPFPNYSLYGMNTEKANARGEGLEVGKAYRNMLKGSDNNKILHSTTFMI